MRIGHLKRIGDIAELIGRAAGLDVARVAGHLSFLQAVRILLAVGVGRRQAGLSGCPTVVSVQHERLARRGPSTAIDLAHDAQRHRRRTQLVDIVVVLPLLGGRHAHLGLVLVRDGEVVAAGGDRGVVKRLVGVGEPALLYRVMQRLAAALRGQVAPRVLPGVVRGKLHRDGVAGSIGHGRRRVAGGVGIPQLSRDGTMRDINLGLALGVEPLLLNAHGRGIFFVGVDLAVEGAYVAFRRYRNLVADKRSAGRTRTKRDGRIGSNNACGAFMSGDRQILLRVVEVVQHIARIAVYIVGFANPHLATVNADICLGDIHGVYPLAIDVDHDRLRAMRGQFLKVDENVFFR